MKFFNRLSDAKFIILFIIILAGILRFYQISSIPVSLYWDEVASTYSAYSILETGKDEYGNSFPLLFRSFQDYKTSANIYLTAIAVKAFGLNEFSARFTSAFLGTLTILSAYFLTLEMFRKRLKRFSSTSLAIITSFLLAISPWHVQFSRTGFEANVGLFFVVTASALLFKYFRSENRAFLFSSMAVFSISIYFYRSIWLFTPLLILTLAIVYRNFFYKHLKDFLIALVIFVIILAPFLPIALSKQGFTRQAQVNIFSNSGPQVYKAAVKQLESGNNTTSKIIFNRRIVYASEIIKGYASHFSPRFLFLQGDGNLRHGVLGMGLLYIWELPFLLIGLIALIKLKTKVKYIVVGWILIAPIAASLSVPSPHALRSLNMLPMPQILVGLGVLTSIYYLKNNYRKFLIFALVVVFALTFLRYLHLYYNVTPFYSALEWADGYKQLVSYVYENENNYDKVLVSGHFWQPYIYFLFYRQYDPNLYQKFGDKSGFDKYLFGGTSWDNGKELGDQDLEKLAGTKNVLIALSPIEYELQRKNVVKITEIKIHGGGTAFIIAKLK